MVEGHLSDEEVAEWLDRKSEESRGSGSVPAHFARCSECRDLARQIREIEKALSEPETWVGYLTPQPDAWMIAEAGMAASEEPEVIPQWIEGLADGTLEAKDLGPPTAARARGLLEEARALFGKRPANALLLAETALAIDTPSTEGALP
jgi:hypothetical protein